MPIKVDSEIGRLRRVLVHRPGREIDWMVPSMMESLRMPNARSGRPELQVGVMSPLFKRQKQKYLNLCRC